MRNINLSYKDSNLDINTLAREVIGAGINVHRVLGMGFDIETYRTCLMYEFDEMGIQYDFDIEFPLIYKNRVVNNNLKIELLIENSIMIDVLSTEQITEDRMFYVLNHLRQGNLRLGLILNFNTRHLRGESIRRVVNGTID